MTEAFTEAIDSLNSLAESLIAMEEEEVRIVVFLVCDLARALVSEDEDSPTWHAHTMHLPIQ